MFTNFGVGTLRRELIKAMSTSDGRADIGWMRVNVRFWPKTDIAKIIAVSGDVLIYVNAKM
jgi:hypothetical protein